MFLVKKFQLGIQDLFPSLQTKSKQKFSYTSTNIEYQNNSKFANSLKYILKDYILYNWI